jgi:hypothetical protein
MSDDSDKCWPAGEYPYESKAQPFITRADCAELPVFLDGSDGSLWQSRESFEQAASCGAPEKRFVRLSDLLALLAPLTTDEPGDSPIPPTVEIPEDTTCFRAPGEAG